MEQAMTIDHFRPVTMRDCQCGGGCGLSFPLKPGQRSRRFHKACPVRLEAVRKAARDYQRAKHARTAPAQPRNVRAKATDGREPNDWCGTCAGLEHRRKVPICPECREPFKDLPALDIVEFLSNRFKEAT